MYVGRAGEGGRGVGGRREGAVLQRHAMSLAKVDNHVARDVKNPTSALGHMI